ncbi:hypothetical protein MRB53_040519 [Persea americana]|nr:hypothetical protein MRB53_040519 [Persea americana]
MSPRCCYYAAPPALEGLVKDWAKRRNLPDNEHSFVPPFPIFAAAPSTTKLVVELSERPSPHGGPDRQSSRLTADISTDP